MNGSDIRKLLPKLEEEGTSKIHIIDPTDNWLEKHIHQFKGEFRYQMVRQSFIY